MAAKKRKRRRATETVAVSGQRAAISEVLPAHPGNDWIAPAIYGVFFVALFLSFSAALESKFVLPKIIVLAAGVGALGLLLLVGIWRGYAIALAPRTFLLTLALGVWWMVSTPFALHLPTALHGEYNRYNGLWTHLGWLSLFLATLAIPIDRIVARRIVFLLVVAILPVALLNIAETAGASAFGLKEISTLGDRVAASGLMNFAIPFAVIALFRSSSWGLKAAIGGVLALLLASEFLSQGRGPWMGLLVAAVILGLGLIRTKAGWKGLAAMLFAMIVLAGLTATLSPVVAQRFTTLTKAGQDESLRQRLVYYRAALRAIAEHPVAGIGFDNFRNSYPTYRAAEDANYFKSIIPTMVHNGYLQAVLTNGIPALLLYLALVAGVLIKLIKELLRETDQGRRDLLLGSLAALSAYLVQDLFGWLDMAVTSAFWIMLGLALNLATQTRPRSAASWAKPVIGACAGLMLLLSAYLLVDRHARVVADAHLYQAQALNVTLQWPEVESLINKALLIQPNDSRNEMVAGQIYATRYASSADPDAYAKGRELLESSFKHNPFDRFRLFNIVALEGVALERGQISAASDISKAAIDKLAETDSDNPGFHELSAWFFAAQGQFGQALSAIRQAQRLAPENQNFRSRELDYQARIK